MMFLHRSPGCSPRSRAAFSIMASSAGVKERLTLQVRLASEGAKSSREMARFGRGLCRLVGKGVRRFFFVHLVSGVADLSQVV